MKKKQKKEVTIRDFIVLACYDANITVDELREGKNARIIDLKRDIVMKLYYDERISLSAVASELGYYDHSGPAKLIAGIVPAEYRQRAIRRGWDNLDIIADAAYPHNPPKRGECEGLPPMKDFSNCEDFIPADAPESIGDNIFYFLLISLGVAAVLISYFIFKN